MGPSSPRAGTYSSFIQWLTAKRRRSRAMGCQTSVLALEERLQRGVAFKVDGDYEAAERELKEVLGADPTHPVDPADLKARNDLALTYTMLGMMDEARAEFETVLGADPTNSVALRNMQYFTE